MHSLRRILLRFQSRNSCGPDVEQAGCSTEGLGERDAKSAYPFLSLQNYSVISIENIKTFSIFGIL